MSCGRIDLQRKLVLYVHGRLSERKSRQIVNHLVKCPSCNGRVAQLAEGERLAVQLQRNHAPNSWSKIERAITAQPQHHPSRNALLGSVAALVACFVFLWIFKDSHEKRVRFETTPYREVSIGEFPHVDEPHVATEGYVSEVHHDPEDGDLMFKLVDDLHRPRNFVMCEILPATQLDAPSVGSKVRVYGVSRYDGQPEHQWFEVHPVLNIEHVR